MYEDLSEEEIKLMVSFMRYEKIIEGMKNRHKRRKMKKQQEWNSFFKSSSDCSTAMHPKLFKIIKTKF